MEDLLRPQGFISSVVKSIQKKTYSSQWKKYKEWCLDESLHPWISDDPKLISYERARDQLMRHLDFLKPQAKSHSVLPDSKSAVCWAFRSALDIELGKDTLILQWMKGWQIEMPKQPRYAPDCEGWDPGAIVNYWFSQPINLRLNQVEMGYKALTLFAIAMFTRPSDLARLARDTIDRLASAIRFNYFGTKELRSVPKLTKTQGLSMDRQEQVCVVRALECYIDLTADPDMFLHQDPVYPFQHVFMSQVVDNHIGPRKGKFFPIGPSTCSRWLRTIMDRVDIPKEFPGGSVRMAAASAAIDRGMPIDVVLSIGRWASWQVFNNFYNRSRLTAVAPPVGRTSLA